MLVRRLIGPVFWGAVVSFAYYLVNMYGLNIGVVEVNEFYGEQFFAVLSTLYAIITALVLIKGLENVDSLTSAVLREATKLRSIAALSLGFRDETTAGTMRHMRTELRFYADNVLAQGSAQRSQANDGAIDGCSRLVIGLATQDPFEATLKAELLRQIEELRAMRATRASLAETRLPGYLIWMLAVMTLSIIAPFFAEHSAEVSFNYYAIFAVSTFGSFIFFMMQDINKPYDGLWAVDFGPFREAAETLSAG